MDSVTTLDGLNITSLAYHAKSDNGKKEKSKKSNFLGFFWRQTVSPHYQVSQTRINDIIQIG